jgi:hypothetical protein
VRNRKATTAERVVLPDVDAALAELARRHQRAIASLVVRVIAVGFLAALLCAQIPWLARHRSLVDALSGTLVLWPFFTALGHLYSWRIALGRAYAGAERWEDTERTLRPLTGLRARLFDAAGEGTYWLALAYRALGREVDSVRLLEALASTNGGWAERARGALHERKVAVPS